MYCYRWLRFIYRITEAGKRELNIHNAKGEGRLRVIPGFNSETAMDVYNEAANTGSKRVQ